MNLNYIILVLLSVFILTNCSRPIELDSDPVKTRTAIVAELDAFDLIFDPVLEVYNFAGKVLHISTTFDRELGGQPRIVTELDGTVVIKNLDSGLSKDLRVDNETNQTWFIFEEFTFKHGESISLETDFSSLGLDRTFAVSKVPFPGTFESLQATNTTTSSFLNIEVSMDLSSLDDPSSKYYLVPYFYQDAAKTIKRFLTLDKSSLTPEQADLFFELTPRHGMFIDYSLIDDSQPLKFNIESNIAAPSGPLEIMFDLSTVNDDFYQYHLFLTDNVSNPSNQDDGSFTNIDKGQGIFSIYSTETQSIVIQ